ncbi:hypothetical protein BS78_05G290400 [Paspalum vaginatum]|nr:hypothetical protein BS78_05G290400 [Paspalum vaginatum]
MNSYTAMDQVGKHWGIWGARRSSSTASPISDWAAAYGSSEPSWEEQAFARDAAAHLGGCVWPPRSYSCTFCQREFRSAQALGGHMNVHRRDRALLRQGGSSSPEDVHSLAGDQTQQGPLLCSGRAASNPTSTTTMSTAAGTTAGSAISKGDVNTTAPPTSYLSTIIKESKNKLFKSMPASMEMREGQAIDQYNHDDGEQLSRTKRRRLDHPSTVGLLIFVQPTAAAAGASTEVTACESQGGVDHDAKVPQTTIPSPSSSFPLVDQQEVDLELRLGTTPKVT